MPRDNGGDRRTSDDRQRLVAAAWRHVGATEEPYLFSDRTDAAKRVWLDDVYAGRA
jgi:hypothetical protein